MKRIIGRILSWFNLYAKDAIVQVLTDKNKRLESDILAFKERIIPSLRNEIELEKAENTMLKEKLGSWRLEVQEDAAMHAARIARLHDGAMPSENGRGDYRRLLADE